MSPASMTLRERHEILGHPLFAQARRLHVAGHARAYHPSVAPAGLKVDVGRIMLLGLILTNDAAADESNPDEWLTPARLKREMGSLSSPRRIDDILGRLRQTGYITLEAHPRDGRMRRLRPTEPLRRWHFDWSLSYFEPLQLLFSNPGFGRMLRYDPIACREFVRCAALNIEVSRWILQQDLKLLAFINHDQAMLSLNTLLVRAVERPKEKVRESELLALVGAFGVSRSHLRNLIQIAIDHDYVRREGPRGQYLGVTHEWIAASDRFVADSLAASELNYRQACRNLDKGN